jgi:hypothetical protein
MEQVVGPSDPLHEDPRVDGSRCNGSCAIAATDGSIVHPTMPGKEAERSPAGTNGQWDQTYRQLEEGSHAFGPQILPLITATKERTGSHWRAAPTSTPSWFSPFGASSCSRTASRCSAIWPKAGRGRFSESSLQMLRITSQLGETGPRSAAGIVVRGWEAFRDPSPHRRGRNVPTVTTLDGWATALRETNRPFTPASPPGILWEKAKVLEMTGGSSVTHSTGRAVRT